MSSKMRRRKKPIVAILLGVGLLLAAGRFYVWRAASLPLRWTPVEMNTPASIKVFSAASPVPGSPVRAWYIDIDYHDASLRVQPMLCANATGRERGGEMARQMGAVVAINGGYFDMEAVPAPTYSLVLRGGKVLAPNIRIVNRSNPSRAYPVTRGAFGVRADRTFDVAWIAHLGNKIWAYPQPVPHTLTKVAPAPNRQFPAGGKPWDAVDAIGGGPVIISDGVIQDTYENEVFFGSGFTSEPYSRAAIGYTRDRHLILLGTDGRNPLPDQGLTLAQTARELQRLGCVEALNLDGGGSETLVVNGQVINQVEGQERAVTSMVGIVTN